MIYQNWTEIAPCHRNKRLFCRLPTHACGNTIFISPDKIIPFCTDPPLLLLPPGLRGLVNDFIWRMSHFAFKSSTRHKTSSLKYGYISAIRRLFSTNSSYLKEKRGKYQSWLRNTNNTISSTQTKERHVAKLPKVT